MSDSGKDKQHRNDIYGNIDDTKSEADIPPAIPAATVVLLRDTSEGPEVLMLHKNSKISFGGMWVFPGGRIDDADYSANRDLEIAARTAAARETHEEAGIRAEPGDFVHFAHWTPPPTTPKRFATWFFAAHTDIDEPISIDGGEIQDHAWVQPEQALARHTAGEIDLAPPTWITLYHLSRYNPASAILDSFRTQEPKVYQTRVAKRSDGVRIAMWSGDAGYEPWDANVEGARHRLVMEEGGFSFENSVEQY